MSRISLQYIGLLSVYPPLTYLPAGGLVHGQPSDDCPIEARDRMEAHSEVLAPKPNGAPRYRVTRLLSTRGGIQERWVAHSKVKDCLLTLERAIRRARPHLPQTPTRKNARTNPFPNLLVGHRFFEPTRLYILTRSSQAKQSVVDLWAALIV